MRLLLLLIAPLIFLGGLTAAAAEQDHHLAAQALRAAVPRVQIAMDEKLGVARHVASPDGFLTGPAGVGKGVAKAAVAGEDRAVRGFMNAWPTLLGGDAAILDTAEVVRDDITAHSGLRTKTWQQFLDGIPVHGGMLIAHTTRHDELVTIGSGFVPAPDRSVVGMARRTALVTRPTYDAQAAATALLRQLKAPRFEVEITSDLAGATHRKILRSTGAQGDIDARLTWFPHTAGDLRLGWNILLTERGHGVMYTAVVDTETLEILSQVRLTSPGLYNPKRVPPPARNKAHASSQIPVKLTPIIRENLAPDAPTSNATTYSLALRVFNGENPTTVPHALVNLTNLNDIGSPEGWIYDSKDTRGNNVDAHLDLDNDNATIDVPRPVGTGTSPVTFNFMINLANEPRDYRSAVVTNLFYWCNVAHDRLYEYGFTESAGNFQNDNFNRGGTGNDAVQADAQDGSGTNNANFSTPTDGTAPRMQMFIFTTASPNRDSSLDATVVLHEYVHGLSNRLVASGASGNLNALQSGGLGEGWGDFYALALLSDPTDDPLATYPVGAYVWDDPYQGIRRYPYAVEPGPFVTAASLNPLTFNDIIANPEVHDMGEVWCQMLWECRGELINKYGAAAGNTLILQLVTDGLKLTLSKPTFLEARDALIRADLIATRRVNPTAIVGANNTELWRAFTKRGLGRSATAGTSSGISGVAESFENSNRFRVSNAFGLRAEGTSNLPASFVATSTTFTVSNPGSSSLNWTVTKNRSWLTLSPTFGTLEAGASVNVTCSLDASAFTLTDGTWLDTLTFSDTTSGLTVTRPVSVHVGPYYEFATESPIWIPTSGHATLNLNDDAVSLARTIPFSFPFYGTGTSQVYLGSNGLMGFVSDLGVNDYDNQPMPLAATPNAIAAALWTDLNPQQGGAIRIGTQGSAGSRKTAITWEGIPPFGQAALSMTFQIVLEEATGDLVMNYNEVRPGNTTYGAGRRATVGVESASGLRATQFSDFGSTLLTNNSAIRFSLAGAVASPANATPTVATPASATPSPVTGTTTGLSVRGNDSGGPSEADLIYTWSLGGTLSSLVTYSANGTHDARDTTATFTKAGTFPLRATITDAGGKSITSQVNVVVNQTLSALRVSPATTSVANGSSVDFTALGFDQFGDAILSEPTVTWSILNGGSGSINTAGLYTASGQGSVTIQAASGALTPATATITVTNGAPTVATPAAASPSPVTATTTSLSVLGADDGLEPALTYTWSTFGTPPAAVTFSATNGSNTGKSCVATFTKAGAYVLRATISDASAATVTSDVNVTVQQTSAAPAMAINPSTATVAASATQLFTAHDADQFGDPIIATTRAASWLTTVGTIAPNGTFTAPSSTGTATITATATVSGQTDTATVTITAGGGGGGGGGDGGGGGGCGLGATSAFAFLLLIFGWRRRRLGD